MQFKLKFLSASMISKTALSNISKITSIKAFLPMIKMMYIHVKSSIGSKVDPNYLPAVCELLEVKTTKTSLQLKNETQMYNYIMTCINQLLFACPRTFLCHGMQ